MTKNQKILKGLHKMISQIDKRQEDIRQKVGDEGYEWMKELENRIIELENKY